MLLCSEYYRVEQSPAALVRLSNGETGWKDDLIELPFGVTIVDERKSRRRKVMWYKLSSSESVERGAVGMPGSSTTFWMCLSAPRFPADGSRFSRSMARNWRSTRKSFDPG